MSNTYTSDADTCNKEFQLNMNCSSTHTTHAALTQTTESYLNLRQISYGE